jgi:hypothetical protein
VPLRNPHKGPTLDGDQRRAILDGMPQEIADAWKAVFTPGWKAAGYSRTPVMSPTPPPHLSVAPETALYNANQLTSVLTPASEEPVRLSMPLAQEEIQALAADDVAAGVVVPEDLTTEPVREDLIIIESREIIATPHVETAAAADEIASLCKELRALCASLHQLMDEGPRASGASVVRIPR